MEGLMPNEYSVTFSTGLLVSSRLSGSSRCTACWVLRIIVPKIVLSVPCCERTPNSSLGGRPNFSIAPRTCLGGGQPWILAMFNRNEAIFHLAKEGHDNVARLAFLP